MISFLDGPAEKTVLNLARTPIFLRVVINAAGRVDALDQLDDDPAEDETIHVYRIVGKPMTGVACSRGRGGGCKRFVAAKYRLHDRQPLDMQARNQQWWTEWAEGEYERLVAEAQTRKAAEAFVEEMGGA